VLLNLGRKQHGEQSTAQIAERSPAFVFQYSICATFEEAAWAIEATRVCTVRLSVLTVELTVATRLEQPPWLREVLQKSIFH